MPYKKLECDDTHHISVKIHDFLVTKTDLLTNGCVGWQFIDTKELLADIPELLSFFASHKMVVMSASVVILYETGQLPLHIDELPIVAKLNFPVCNTIGWTTRWFTIDKDEFDNASMITNQFGASVENLRTIPNDKITLLAELADMKTPIIFNSRIPHDVIKTSSSATTSPRIIASFTFFNNIEWFLV